VEYDRFGRLVGWKWDDLLEEFEFDRAGRLAKVRYADGTTLSLTFKDLGAFLVSQWIIRILLPYALK
jgi:hypothetical protein